MSGVIFEGLVYAGTPDGDFLTDETGALLLLPGYGNQPGPLGQMPTVTNWAPIPELDPYAQALIALIPEGVAWTREPDSALAGLVQAQAASLSRVHRAADDLVAESAPSAALMLLPDYEGVLGLPGPCATELAESVAERRLHVWSRWTATGGATPAFLIGLAAQLGYDVTIEEFRGSEVGVFCVDDELVDIEALHCFIVHAGVTAGFDFTAGDGGADEPLGWFVPNAVIECAIRRARPAHTWAGFAYEEA